MENEIFMNKYVLKIMKWRNNCWTVHAPGIFGNPTVCTAHVKFEQLFLLRVHWGNATAVFHGVQWSNNLRKSIIER